MAEFTLKSGNKLVVSMAAFADGNALRKAVARCETKDIHAEDSITRLLSDDDVEKCVFVCATSAIYEGAKVNRDLFDDAKLREAARGDYFEIFAKIMEVNLNPFFPKAPSA